MSSWRRLIERTIRWGAMCGVFPFLKIKVDCLVWGNETIGIVLDKFMDFWPFRVVYVIIGRGTGLTVSFSFICLSRKLRTCYHQE